MPKMTGAKFLADSLKAYSSLDCGVRLDDFEMGRNFYVLG